MPPKSSKPPVASPSLLSPAQSIVDKIRLSKGSESSLRKSVQAKLTKVNCDTPASVFIGNIRELLKKDERNAVKHAEGVLKRCAKRSASARSSSPRGKAGPAVSPASSVARSRSASPAVQKQSRTFVCSPVAPASPVAAAKPQRVAGRSPSKAKSARQARHNEVARSPAPSACSVALSQMSRSPARSASSSRATAATSLKSAGRSAQRSPSLRSPVRSPSRTAQTVARSPARSAQRVAASRPVARSAQRVASPARSSQRVARSPARSTQRVAVSRVNSPVRSPRRASSKQVASPARSAQSVKKVQQMRKQMRASKSSPSRNEVIQAAMNVLRAQGMTLPKSW